MSQHHNDADIEALMREFEASDLAEMHLRAGDVELFLARDATASPPWAGTATRADAAVTATSAAAAPKTTTAAPVAPAAATAAPEVPAGGELVRAPYMGTFYRAPKPGAAHFVEPGQHVAVGTELCLVEVMKLFTAVRAGVSGTVQQVLAQDGQLVQEGAPLFLIVPAG